MRQFKSLKTDFVFAHNEIDFGEIASASSSYPELNG